MLPKLSIIVPAKNEEKVIGNCIDSLLKVNYPKNMFEIMVVVDGSTDRTVEIAKSYGKKIRLIRTKPKKCKADALNHAVPLARGEIIGIYDADCIISKNCLKKAVRHFSNKDIAGVSCTLKSTNKRQNIITQALSIETCFISYTEYFLNKRGFNSIFFGRNMFIRKDILKKMGKFDCKTFMEDGELNIKLRREGYNIKFEPRAIAWTEEPSTIRGFIRQRTRWTRGFLKVQKKHPYKSFRNFYSDIIHGLCYYTSPILLLIIATLIIQPFLNIILLLTLPLSIIFSFNIYLIAKSRLFYNESLKDLFYLPLFFLLGTILTGIFIRSWYHEKKDREMKWFRPERTGHIKR